MKRSTERAQLALTSSDNSRGQLFLDFARTRLAEASSMRDTAGFSGVLDDMDGDTREGAKLLHSAAVARDDAAPLDAVDKFVSGQRQQISGLLDRLPTASRDRAAKSLALLDQVSHRAKGLRAAFGCGAATVGSDALGPKPATCGSAPEPDRADPPPTGSDAPDRGGSKPAPERTEAADRTPGGSAGSAPPPATRAPDVPAPVAQPTPTPAPTPSAPGDDEGLLHGLGRILGDLLG
jgi:hypothetical protein